MKRLFRQTLFCLAISWCCALLAFGQAQAVRPIEFAEIPVAFHAWLKEQGITAGSFAAYRQRLRQETAQREERGEFEHLIYYVLQSQRFTAAPKLEPALSAQAFAQSLTSAQRAQWLAADTFTPELAQLLPVVRQRMQAFVAALRDQTTDERMRYFQQFTKPYSKGQLLLALCRAYAQTMRFLYRKEFAAATQAAEVATLYQTRGHSTDTQIEANFAIREALSLIKAADAKLKLQRVLIVGPGLDFAPRTDLLDDLPPASYQPFAVADALLQLQLAEAGQLRIDCADINSRVLAHLQQLPRQKPYALQLFSGLAERGERKLSEEFKSYFNQLGAALGPSQSVAPPTPLAGHLGRRIEVNPSITASLRAQSLNVVLERFEPSPRYDLIVVTNVFPYFSDAELLLACQNLTTMLGENGYLVHNERRVTAPAVSQAFSIPVQHSRTLLIATGQGEPLYDFVAVHHKKNN